MPVPAHLHRKFLRVLAASIALSLLVLTLLVTWVLATTSGTRVFLKAMATLSPPSAHLSIGEIQGRLLDHLVIEEFSYQSHDLQVALSGLSLDWHPWALLTGKLDISTLHASSIRVATLDSAALAQLPANLRLPFALALERFALGRAVIGHLQSDASVQRARTFSAISGSASSNNLQHQVEIAFASEWGDLQLKGQLLSTQPYTLSGDVNYQGQAKGRINTAVMAVQGKLSGTLALITLDAHAQPSLPTEPALSKPAKTALQGQVHLVAAPFQAHPLRELKASLLNLDPSAMQAQMPHAMLDLDVDLKALEDASGVMPAKEFSPKANAKAKQASGSTEFASLGGALAIKNNATASFDRQSLPLKRLQATLEWRGQHLQLTNTRIELGAGKLKKLAAPSGKIMGDIDLHFLPNALPKIDAKLTVHALDLSSIHSRLRSTEIRGEVGVQSKVDRIIALQLQLHDPHTSVEAQGHFRLSQAGDSGLLSMEKLMLSAEESRFSGSGDIDFEGGKKFHLQGNLTQFNPAYWFALPKGSIDGELNLSGSLDPKVIAKIQLPKLEGTLSGQKLSGVIQADWQQEIGFDVRQFELQWGRNHIAAMGMLGKDANALNLDLVAEDLALLSAGTVYPFSGKAALQAQLTGKLNALSLEAKMQAENLRLPKMGRANFDLRVANLDAKLKLGVGNSGAIDLKLTANHLQRVKSNVPATSVGEEKNASNNASDCLSQLSVSVFGRRDAHRLSAQFTCDGARQVNLAGDGGIESNAQGRSIWRGNLDLFSLTGFVDALTGGAEGRAKRKQIDDLQLQGKVALEVGTEKVEIGSATFAGSLGVLDLRQFEWTPASISSKGSVRDVNIVNALNLIRPQERLMGDLQIGMQWNVQMKDSVRGEIALTRQRGDLSLMDVDGTGQEMALGINDLQVFFSSGGLIPGSDAEEIRASLIANGTRLGRWQGNAQTRLRKLQDKWTFSSDAPLKGELHANVPELQWLASQLHGDFSLKGALKVDGTLDGNFSEPRYQAQLEGQHLELAIASEGLLFPNGEFKAQLNQDTFNLSHLKFSNKISFTPKLEQFQGLNLRGEEGGAGDSGSFIASGTVNLRTETGAIQADWHQFPLLQRKDRWLVVSGQASITQKENVWALIGKLKADAAYFKLPKMPPPNLSSDVIVNRGINLEDEAGGASVDKKGFKIKADLSIDMGSHFVFVGRGLSTGLTGTLRLRSNDGATLHASGSIVTTGGHYEGYGQALQIERGILNFQGSPSNPTLNVRALRKGLAVEAGVDVTGSFANPQVRLVSEPNVPDAEKLSWLVLGREPEQAAGNDATLLLTAAGAIFGGDGSRNFPNELAQKLGFDSFTIAPAENGGATKLPSQTVAGATVIGAAASDNVLAAKMRLRPGLVLAVERSVSDATGGLRLIWQLSRRVKIVGYKGSDNSVDAKYSFSFN